MSKFTPGPWHIQRYKNGRHLHIETTGFFGSTIARIEQREEQLANAQAIAALPELVAALELAAKYVAKMVADNVDTVLPPQKALDRIEQALAKVEGK